MRGKTLCQSFERRTHCVWRPSARLTTALRVADRSPRTLNGCFGLAQYGSQEFFSTSRASHADEHRSSIRVGIHLECQEGATLALCGDHGGHKRYSLPIAWQAEGIPIREFLGRTYSGPKLGKECALTLP